MSNAVISPGLVLAIGDLVAVIDTPERREAYLAGAFFGADSVKDLDRRYRWDLLWASGAYSLVSDIEGLKDAHIDTALRSAVAPLVAS